MRRRTSGLALGVAALIVITALLARGAGAYIERLYSLQEILNESTNVLVAVVETVDPEKKRATLRVLEDLKGKSGWRKININFAVGQFDHPVLMMKRLAPGLPAIMFYKQEGGSFASETHVFGSWVQAHAGDGPDRDNVWWNFTHIEIHLQRTYSGSTPAFIQLVRDILAQKKEPPTPNPKQASGPGPELPAVIPPEELYRPPGKPAAAATPAGPKPTGAKPATAKPAGTKPVEVARAVVTKPAALPAPGAPPAIPAAAGAAAAGELFTRELTLGSLGSPVLGVSWVDFDADGKPDAYACSAAGNRLFRNQGDGTFQDVTGAAGLSGGSRSAAWADCNGDGLPDLVLDTPRLFTNLGGRFRDDTARLPAERVAKSACVAWLDANADGRPDLLVARQQEPGGFSLLVNAGKTGAPAPAPPPPAATPAPAAPVFRDASKQVLLVKDAPAIVRGFLTVADLTGDGRADVLCGLQEFIVLRNTAPCGLSATPAAGIQMKTDPEWPIGAAVGDLDNDGVPDLFIPQRQGGRLYRGRGKGAFEDVTARSPELARLGSPCRAACWFDANGDGCADLYVATEQGPGRLFLNDRSGILADRTDRTALAARGPRGGAAGVAAGDFDGDGDLDLLMGSRSGRVVVQANGLQRSPAHAFVQVRFDRLAAGLGSQVDLLSVTGRLLGCRQISGGENFGSQGEPAAFFPARPGKYQLRVRFADGTVLDRALDVPAEGTRLQMDAQEVAASRRAPRAAVSHRPVTPPRQASRANVKK